MHILFLSCLKATELMEKKLHFEVSFKEKLQLKVFARTNAVNDVHKLSVSDVVTDSTAVADFTDIQHI